MAVGEEDKGVEERGREPGARKWDAEAAGRREGLEI